MRTFYATLAVVFSALAVAVAAQTPGNPIADALATLTFAVVAVAVAVLALAYRLEK